MWRFATCVTVWLLALTGPGETAVMRSGSGSLEITARRRRRTIVGAQTLAPLFENDAALLTTRSLPPDDGAEQIPLRSDADASVSADALEASRTDLLPSAKHGSGAPVSVELRLPEVTLRDLHSDSNGSLARLLLELRATLARLARVEERCIGVVGIHERYEQPKGNAEKASRESRQHVQVLVRLEVLPGSEPGGPSAEEVVQLLIHTAVSSWHLEGPLGALLSNATLVRGSSAREEAMTAARHAQEQGEARLSAMALPIGISAAFTGVLVWLTAW